MASLERRGRRYRVRWREDGRHRASGWLTHAAALDARDAIQARLGARRPQGPAPLGWAELCERWALDLARHSQSAYQHRAPATVARCGRRCGWRYARDAHRAEVQALPPSVARLVRVLLRWARREAGQTIDEQALVPARAVGRRRVAPELLTAEQVAGIIAEAGRWSACSAALCHCLATYGHRPQSLAAARVGDYQAGGLTLRVKGGDEIRHQVLPATAALLAELVRGRPPGAALFLSHHGRPWADGAQFSIWFYHNIGERLTPATPGCYHLKRYALSRMLSLGLDLATICSITGHRRPDTILRYARTNADRQSAALAALALASVP